MTDKPTVVKPGPGSVRLGAGAVELSTQALPIVYFEDAVSLSHMNGIVSVTLTVGANLPNAETGGVELVQGVVAHLKCNVIAARSLVAALNSALLLAQPVENPEGRAN